MFCQDNISKYMSNHFVYERILENGPSLIHFFSAASSVPLSQATDFNIHKIATLVKIMNTWLIEK